MTKPLCQCKMSEVIGEMFCERHQCMKSYRLVELCNMGARGIRLGVKYWEAWEEGHGPRQSFGGQRMPENPTQQNRKYLGDRLSGALALIGITEERVTEWMGRPCGCGKRREQLNLLHSWAEKQLRGLFKNRQEAKEELKELLENKDV